AAIVAGTSHHAVALGADGEHELRGGLGLRIVVGGNVAAASRQRRSSGGNMNEAHGTPRGQDGDLPGGRQSETFFHTGRAGEPCREAAAGCTKEQCRRKQGRSRSSGWG